VRILAVAVAVVAAGYRTAGPEAATGPVFVGS
jgi:hypothetical protein